MIAFNIDKAHSEVNRRLSEFVGIGLFKRVKRGYYETTDAVEGYLSGDFDPDNF